MALCKGMKGKSEKKIGVKISSLEGSLPCRCLYYLECGKVLMARSDKRAVSKMNAWFATQQRTISVASSRLT